MVFYSNFDLHMWIYKYRYFYDILSISHRLREIKRCGSMGSRPCIFRATGFRIDLRLLHRYLHGEIRPTVHANLGNCIFCVGTGLMYLYTITNTLETIIILYLTRSLAGVAYGMYLTAAYAIITSEYSDTMNRTVALLENFVGLGMISGPLIGNILRYLAGDCFEFLGYSLSYIISIPLTYYCLSELKPYTVTKAKVNVSEIIKKPVIII